MAFALTCAAATGAARGEALCVVHDANGATVFTNSPPDGVCREVAVPGSGGGGSTPSGTPAKGRPVSSSLEKSVDRHAGKYGVSKRLVKAVIQAESGGNPGALSPKGAQGVMQLMPATAKRFDVSDPWDPDQNIEGGVKYLAHLLDVYKGDTTRAVAAYNAGEGAVDRFGGVPPYRETRDYVRKVMDLSGGGGGRVRRPTGESAPSAVKVLRGPDGSVRLEN